METWHVYQLRSDTELLYVGYTRRLKCRLREHERQKPWWQEVTDIRLEEFSSEDAARQREKEIWADARPKHNRHSPFRTDVERRNYIAAHQYVYDRSSKGRERTRRSNQKTGAARQRRYKAKRSQQSGPTHFD
jgi:predicted GIY-YIG superfamily endonuclease